MRRMLLLLIFLFAGIQVAQGSVEVRICGPNEVAAFDPNSNIMVGQELTLIVSCDPNDYWSGAFFIEGSDRALGTLSARDSDPNLRDFTDSHYPAAGDYADVWAWRDSDIWGFDMYSSDSNCVTGDWFIIDYKAEKAGTCEIDFYDYNSSWTEPNLTFTLHQDPSCDFNEDGIVNLIDFNKLSYYWLADCNDCNDVNDCLAVDLDFNETIDSNDLAIFAKYWLWDGSIREIADANEPVPDPNLIYSVVDANGLDEITMYVGNSITLYVDLTTIDHNDLMSFDIEVHISDPSLGTIDNAEDPNGTAAILASPRTSSFDYWGPGRIQEEGIYLAAFYLTFDPNSFIANGHLASFVYTAEDANDVELSIVNISSRNISNEEVYPTVEPILIHQVASQQMMGGGSEMMGAAKSISTGTEQLSQPLFSLGEMISFLEKIYQEDKELQKNVDPIKWQEFIDSVKESYKQSY